MTLTAGEQYLLELINRARLDPAAEASRYRLGLNDGLAAGTIDTKAKQVLALDGDLDQAADAHSRWMLEADTFSHTGQGGSNAGARMQDAGYRFEGSWGWRENLAWVGSTGKVDMAAAIESHHEGLYRSSGHRVNTFAGAMEEIGIGQVAGSFTHGGRTYNSSMLTEKFAMSGSDAHVTGVAYRDGDRDYFYSIGEGQRDIWVRSGATIATTEAAGGYGIAIAPGDAVAVAVGRGSTTLAQAVVDLTDGNVKLDVVTQMNGALRLDLSGDTRLVSGISTARLLGVGDLELDGSGASNTLTGNAGRNRIDGEGGNDRLYGLSGNDTIWGGTGSDHMVGGTGNDTLRGEADGDKLYGDAGNDRLYGDDGNDMLMGGTGSDHMVGGIGNDTLRGEADGDKLYGDAGNDTLAGGDGNDRLVGGNDNDRLFGDAGNDRLYGDTGNDMLAGGDGNDHMVAGVGNDRLYGDAGNDRMWGNAGADLFVFSAGRDLVADFEDNVDTIGIARGLGGGNMTVNRAMVLAEVVDGDAVFDFGDGHVLTVADVANLSLLANDLIII